jgi:hypothetical protein
MDAVTGLPPAARLCLHHPESLAEAGVKVGLLATLRRCLPRNDEGSASVVLETATILR